MKKQDHGLRSPNHKQSAKTSNILRLQIKRQQILQSSKCASQPKLKNREKDYKQNDGFHLNITKYPIKTVMTTVKAKLWYHFMLAGIKFRKKDINDISARA